MGALSADLQGETVLVTGGSSGIGKQIAANLASMGAKVVIAVRDPTRGERVAHEIGSAVEVMRCDFSRQDSIREFAVEFLRGHPRLDVLVNNAGGWNVEREVTPEGLEKTWATNVLGYHLTTQLLLPALRAAGADTPTWLASAPELEGVTGKFWQQRTARPCRYRDLPRCQALFERCQEMTAVAARAA